MQAKKRGDRCLYVCILVVVVVGCIVYYGLDIGSIFLPQNPTWCTLGGHEIRIKKTASSTPEMMLFLSTYLTNSTKAEELLFTLYSYKKLQRFWSRAFLFVDSSKEVNTSEFRQRLGACVADVFNQTDLIHLVWYRPSVQEEWQPEINRILAYPNDTMVFFLMSHDHAFIDFDVDVIEEGLVVLHEDSAKYKALYVSHWPEGIRFATAHPPERIGRAWVRTQGILAEGMIITTNDYLQVIFREIIWGKVQTEKRVEDAVQNNFWFGAHGCPNNKTRSDPGCLRFHDWPALQQDGGTALFFPLREQMRHHEGHPRFVSMPGTAELFVPLNLSNPPYYGSIGRTGKVPAKLLASRLLAKHWTYYFEVYENMNFPVLHDWIITMLCLNGEHVADQPPAGGLPAMLATLNESITTL